MLEEIALALTDRAQAQRGSPDLSKIAPQSVRIATEAAAATEALAVDVANVMASTKARVG